MQPLRSGGIRTHNSRSLKQILLLLAVLTVLLFGVSYRISQREKDCVTRFQPQIDNAVVQLQTVFGNREQTCESSYYVVSDLDLCLVQADSFLPKPVAPAIRRLAENLMVFFRNQPKDMAMVKRDHDERCKLYTRFMFNPPQE